jgi:type III restriction enzyme
LLCTHIKYIKEGALQRYVHFVLENNSERLDDIKSRYLVYVQKVRQYIDVKAKEHATKNFEKRVNEGKITLEKSFSLKETIKPIRPESGIAKSLYEKYHGLNGDESKFISEIASLENVLFWHKFGTRTKADFCINGGYLNHYPDFLIVTKSGNYIIVETKGDDRDNSDTKAKIRLGEKWASLAGSNYQYFVAFAERNNVEGATTFKDVINIVKSK